MSALARQHLGRGRGFTLIELIVSITISSVVVVFVAMFTQAPIDAYEDQSLRVALTADATAAWPLMEADLHAALPNSLRTRRNGGFVALELLKVTDWVRYEAPLASPITVAGMFRDAPLLTLPLNDVDPDLYYLSVNNPGAPSPFDAYTLTGSMTPANTNIRIVATAIPGELEITLIPAHVFLPAGSPGQRIYLVEGPVTFLCDEGAGTLRRYENYPVAANQAARDTPADFAALGLAGTLLARGLTRCDVYVSPTSTTEPQTAAVRLTATRNGDSLTLMHTARAEYVP